MKERFEKINDYTIAHVVEMAHTEKTYSNTLEKRCVELTRIFNFESAQVTTVGTSATVTWPRAGYSGGSGVSDSMQTVITDFADLSSERELRRMHAQLRSLGGSPPPLEDVVRLIKKPALSARAQGMP